MEIYLVVPVEIIVEELFDRDDIKLFNALMKRYHAMGVALGLGKPRFFVGKIDVYWVAGAILQSPAAWSPALRKYRVDTSNSYFIRRVARFAPMDVLVDFLIALGKKLKEEGRESLISFGLKGHRHSIYEKAGFEVVGYTKSGRPIYVLHLKKL